MAVTFDGPNKLIIVPPSDTEVNIKEDVYSDWKEWVLLSDNAKFLQAMRSTGGDVLPGVDEFLGSTFFMVNGWKIEISASTVFEGNLFDEDGGAAITPLSGIVLATAKVSTLVERVPPPVTNNAKVFT